jgi:hypothetical protein
MKLAVLKEKNEEYKEKFLVHAVDEIQADVLESLLRSYKIPVLKKRRQAGGYLNIAMGMNIFGVDIYVPSQYHNAAKRLLQGTSKCYHEPDTEFRNEEEKFRRKRLIRIWIIIAMFYLPVLLWLAFAVR